MARPKVLPDDLLQIKSAGINTVISLLESTEATSIGLEQEATTCFTLGLTFLTHPVRDMHLPDPGPFAAFAADIAARMNTGAHVALHCYASIGRSGMLACCVLGHFGFDAERALHHVRLHRGVPVPDTAAQTAFIKRAITAQHP